MRHPPYRIGLSPRPITHRTSTQRPPLTNCGRLTSPPATLHIQPRHRGPRRAVTVAGTSGARPQTATPSRDRRHRPPTTIGGEHTRRRPPRYGKQPMRASQHPIHIGNKLRHRANHPPKLTRKKTPHHNGGKKVTPASRRWR